ncbi:MAG: Smr/MutS family protein [Deltaproteobacteria bacterium]|nr:Smr/MutS family protein [Deltaproteobacteria bacterium]
MKKDCGFNTPFATLNGLEIKKKPKRPKPKPPMERGHIISENDEGLFARAMQGVKRIKNDQTTREPKDQQTEIELVKKKLFNQDQAVINELNDLVRGTRPFDISSSGEYLEGHVTPIDSQTTQKLKAGKFTIQDHLDLHGFSREEAQFALDSFLQNAHALGQRCVLVIHGRGLKSSQGPVLKTQIAQRLTTGKLSHLVLAFCSARPCDGGTGALYVLLRKRPRKSVWKKTFDSKR